MATWDRYKSKKTGLEIKAYTGKIFTPRGYCCDSSSVYVTKAPVAVLKLTPTVQFVSTNIAWDVTQSYSPTGTVDTFDLTFGGGGASDLTGQDWSTDPKTGNVQYTSTGTYTVTLYVTDTLGNRSQAAKIMVNVVSLLEAVAYIAAANGIYRYLAGGSVTRVLSSTYILSGRLNPHYAHLPQAQHHYWAGTNQIPGPSGVGVYSFDGGTTWADLGVTAARFGSPANTAGDSPAPTSSDLDLVAFDFDPQDPKRLYALMVTNSTWNASYDPRAWLFWSDDYGETFSNVQIGV